MATPIQQEDLSFELGDRILILGGRHDGLRGRIYYIDDESLIRVLPDGVSDRLVELPIIDNDFDPDLEITEAFSISKRTNPAFVAQIDAHVGSRAYTFGLNGEPGPVYIVKSVSEKDDTLLLTDETGAELLLECNFKGIPLDEAFAVIRVRAPEDVSINVDGDVVGEDAPPEEEGDDFMDVVEDALESELQFEIQEIPKAQRFYPDLVQRNDMLQDLVASLNAVQQKSPEEHKAIRIFVEQCILLRNSLVIYSKSGEPIGIRQTSYSTLSELLEDAGNIPLSRYILNASKTLYLDRDREEIRNEVIEPHSENGLAVNLKFLDVTINNTVDYMNTQLGGIQSASENVNSLPNWFISWETLNMQFHSNWTSHGDVDTVQFKADKEFFRGIPDIESAGIDGLPRLEADKDTLVNSDLVSKVSIGMMRGLGPRATRLKQKDDAQRRVESAEMGELTGTLVFPLSEKRDLGAIRSGSIAQDIAMSQMESQTMHTILERLEGIPDTATAGGILSVGMDGNTQGNIPLEDWLRVLPIHPLGMGDIPLSLANYGLVQKEFTLDQQDVFVEKFQMMRALIKQYIIEIREAANKAASEHTITANPFLSETAFEEMRAVLEKEPLLAEGMETLGKLTPTYKGSDVATISYLLLTAQDLFIKGLAQIPGPLAVERSRRVRQQFLDALNNALAKALKRKNSGEEPVPNTCPHVASINAIYRVKDVALRMPLFAKFLTKFQGGRKDNWVECAFGCGRPICCYHEVLLLQEYLHPREKDALHKELLLKFSGGQFNGRYMCKNCGQSISELEFDTNLEFSDDGIPMMGRAVMAALDDEVDTALTGTDVEQLRFKTEAQNLIYAAARKLFDMLGINAVSESYTMIVQRVEADVLKQPSRKEYPKMIDGKRTLDYDIHINRIIVGSVAVNCLLEIQTNIPGYVMRYRIPGCRAGFSGYPLGNEKERTGMEYVACAVAAIQDPIAPWNLTGFQREAEKKRQDSVLALMDKRMTALLTNSSAQQQISVKRSHLKELFGSVVYSEQLPEQIPERFAPTPYNISDEETAKSAIVSQAASPSQVIRAWVLQAHRYAKDNGSYKKESVIAEATCCSSPIQTPNEFWKEKKDSMTTLPAKLPPRGPINSHLGLPFSPRRQENLEGKISPEIMYKIFLNVCYQGERIGLPHVPGYTNECTYCGFVYAESPYALNPVPPMSSDSKVQRDMMKSYNEEIAAIITKGKVSLETNKVKVNQGTFENILDLSHKAFRVEPIVAKRPLAGMKLFERLRTLTPEPFVGWKAAISVTLERLGALQENDDILEAYGTISNISSDIIEELKARLGEVNATALKRVLEGNPVQCIEIVRTHFLVPFQRLVTGFHTKSLRIPKSYKLGEGTEEDMNRILDSHLEYMATLAKRSTGFTLHKMKWAHARLVDALGLLKSSIRASYIPGGEAGLPFIVTALIGGILVEFINPNVVPPDMDEAAAGSVDTGARAPIQILDVCVQKLRLEGMNFTEEQIKDMIARRDNIEKASFIKRFDDLTPEAKAVEKMKKKLGLGDWAVGGTNVIYAYNPEQYEREREQRVTMGFEDFSQGQVVLEEGAEGAEGGYDNQQMGEDDY